MGLFSISGIYSSRLCVPQVFGGTIAIYMDYRLVQQMTMNYGLDSQ